MEPKPITISFKNTQDEQRLYEIINSHSSKGGFIKDILIDVLVKKRPVTAEKNDNYVSEISEIFDL